MCVREKEVVMDCLYIDPSFLKDNNNNNIISSRFFLLYALSSLVGPVGSDEHVKF